MKAAPSSGKGLGHIPSLDGIRAASFLLVFLGHVVPIWMSRYIPPGFGVTVFFVLSGFLITTLLRLEYDETGTISLKNFYLRRSLRILPPFYICLGLSALLVKAGVLGGSLEAGPMAALAAHVGNYWQIFRGLEGAPEGTTVYWSLAIEEHFYLFFPLLYLGLRRALPKARHQAAALLGICAVVLLWRIILTSFFHPSVDRMARATDTRVDLIIFGCVLAIAANPILDPTSWSEARWKYVVLPLAACGLLSTWLIRTPLFHDAIRGTIHGLALCPFFIVAVRYPRWAPMRIFNTRVASFLGVLSFTLYLAHRAVLATFETTLHAPWWARMIAGLLISILFAWGMHVLVERPCAQLRKKLSAVSAEVPVPAPAERTLARRRTV